MRKWIDRVGWTLGFIISVIFPKTSAPVAAALPFDIGGTIFGMLGFALMYGLAGTQEIAERKKWYLVAGAAVIGVLAGAIYLQMLFSRAYVTPGPIAEWVEFILFCISYFGVFAVIAFVYRSGGLFILRKLNKLPLPAA